MSHPQAEEVGLGLPGEAGGGGPGGGGAGPLSATNDITAAELRRWLWAVRVKQGRGVFIPLRGCETKKHTWNPARLLLFTSMCTCCCSL
jgi:hypothetical protein